jgi:hypothetical protein
MRSRIGLLCCLLLSGSMLTFAQTGSGKPVSPATGNGVDAAKSVGSSPAELEHNFFAILRNGDALKFLAYIPEDGVNVGRDAVHQTHAEIEDQLTNRKGLYCQLFDSACIQATIKLDASAPRCSYRELLTQSEKVRTASTETTRNGVRQAVLVAEVHNQKCAGPGLIDFIFNYHEGGWKLFSIP